MNILIFTAIYPASAEYAIHNDTKIVHYYAKQWKQDGHAVQVIYLHMIPVKRILCTENLKKCCGIESDYEYDGIRVHLLEYQLLVPKTNYLSGFQVKNARRRIAEFLDGCFVPDRVFVHFPCCFKGIGNLSEFRCPTMAVLHNVDLQILQKYRNLTGELNRYQQIGGRNHNICRIASERLSRRVSLVLSGIEESLIAEEAMVGRKLARSSGTVRIVYAGNLIKLKNVDVIIKALKQVSFAYQFEIIGDGPEKKKLMKLAQGNASIVFRGRMSRTETIQKMREADIFVMVSSPETFGLVYLEAMAQGCVTIGSRHEGIDGVILDGKNGFLVEPGNVEALVRCLEQAAAMDREHKKDLVSAAYDTAAGMTDRNMADRYFRLNQ